MVKAVKVPRYAPSGRQIPSEVDPVLEELVRGIIAQVADKWTMLVLEVLEEGGTMRFTEISRSVPEISQKMLTQTLRAMERDGFVDRLVHAVVPPKVEYSLTELGLSLSAAFCGVWEWAASRHTDIEEARRTFATKKRQTPSKTSLFS